jgi:hypothetical protein
MRFSRTAFATALALFAAERSFAAGVTEIAAETMPAGTLLYLDQSYWQQTDEAQKIALATDFMRIFCGDPAMPPSVLVGCLDRVRGSGSMFERALSCVATRPPVPAP